MTREEQRLVTDNLGFAVGYVNRYQSLCNETVLFEDIRQQGVLGLCEAAQRYDPDRGVKFISYAVFWIRACVNSWLTYHYTTVRPPSSRDERSVICDMCSHPYRAAGFIQTCPECKHQQRRYRVTMVYPTRDDTANWKLNRVTISEENMILVSGESAPDIDACRGIDGRYLEHLMSDLSPKDRDILTMRWSEGWTLKDIGLVYGVTKEAIRLRHNMAMAKVRKKAMAGGDTASKPDAIYENILGTNE